MDLSHNELCSLPDEFSNVFNLKQLLIPHNKLSSLPPSLFNLNELKSLDLSHNQLTNIPQSIRGLVALVEVNLSSNRLVDLPIEICSLGTTVELFRINDNGLTSLPLTMERGFCIYFPHLLELELNNNNILELPHDIGEMTSLRVLEVAHNKLSQLPEGLKYLRNLTRLDARSNCISETPFLPHGDNFSQCYLSSNALRHFVPSRVCPARGLTIIDLKANKLTTLPDDIAQLKGLQVLDLSNNDISSKCVLYLSMYEC